MSKTYDDTYPFIYPLIVSIFFLVLFVVNIIPWIYFKYNNYNKIDIIFIVLFCTFLFAFLYSCVNLFISKYCVINYKKEDVYEVVNNNNIQTIRPQFSVNKEIQVLRTLSIAMLSILLPIIIFFIFNFMMNNQYTFINNTYKTHIVFASLVLVSIIFGIYFGI